MSGVESEVRGYMLKTSTLVIMMVGEATLFVVAVALLIIIIELFRYIYRNYSFWGLALTFGVTACMLYVVYQIIIK